MSKELELLQKALEWMEELKYAWANVRDSGDYDLLELIADINKIEKLLLAQPEPEQEVYAKGYAEAMKQQVYEAYESGRKSALTEQEPVAWMYEFAVRSSWDASFTGEWKEEISRSKPITDGIVKGFNPTKLERTVRNLIPLYKAHGIVGGE